RGDARIGESVAAREREEGVELGELEERAEVFVEIRQAQGAIGLTNPLREGHEGSEPGAVDVARVGEVDDEVPGAAIDLGQHGVAELLAVPRDELPLDGDDDLLPFPRAANAHGASNAPRA